MSIDPELYYINIYSKNIRIGSEWLSFKNAEEILYLLHEVHWDSKKQEWSVLKCEDNIGLFYYKQNL